MFNCFTVSFKYVFIHSSRDAFERFVASMLYCFMVCGSFFLLFYSRSSTRAPQLLLEWGRLAALLAGARDRLRIGLVELDENEVVTDGLTGAGVTALGLKTSPAALFLLMIRRIWGSFSTAEPATTAVPSTCGVCARGG